MNFVLRIWRQASAEAAGKFEDYPVENIGPNFSFLEVLDLINEGLPGARTPPR